VQNLSHVHRRMLQEKCRSGAKLCSLQKLLYKAREGAVVSILHVVTQTSDRSQGTFAQALLIVVRDCCIMLHGIFTTFNCNLSSNQV
jgi:hypothetical protein